MTNTPPETLREAMARQWPAEKLAKPATRQFAINLVSALSQTSAEAMRALIKRVEELERRPALREAGIWNEHEVYEPGDVVTCSGSAWVAKARSHGTRPGSDEGCWRLMVKKGRDGRDGKDAG